jgi:quinol-cytochrome oxidoreductase complex cytochrome b subunit
MNLSGANEGKSWSLRGLDYAVPENAQRVGYSLGGIVLVGYILASLTGLIIAFLYIPTVAGARESVTAYTAHPLGLWLRSFHRWSADVILYLVILHMSRVVFTGSYRGKRKANWLFGIVLLFVSAGFLLSGTITRWDQEGYEAYKHLVETTKMLPLIGVPIATLLEGTLTVMRLFATHVLVLPVVLGLFLVPHLVLMKVNGLSRYPENANAERKVMFSDHLKRVLLYSIVVYGLTAVIAALWPPDLLPGPYNGIEITKPPWPFLPFYAMEDLIGLYALLVIPILILVGLVVVPFVDRRESLTSTARTVIVSLYSALMAAAIFGILYVALTPPVNHIGMAGMG